MEGRENLTYLLRIKQNAEIMHNHIWRSLKDKVFVPKAYIKDYMNHHSHPTISIVFYCHNHFWECFQTLPLPSAHCIDLCVHKIRVERGEDPHLNIRPSINIFPIQLFQQLLEYNWIFWHICIFVFKWRQGIYAGFNVHIPKSVTDLRDTRH